jgi:hypothetical protein
MVVSVVAAIIVARRDSGSYYAMAVIDLAEAVARKMQSKP